jgi:hypothetical protein
MTTRLLRWATVTFTAMVSQAVAGMAFIGDRMGTPPGEPAALLGWSLVSSGLVSGVLLALAGRSRWNWPWSVPALFGLAYGTTYVVNLIDAVVFNVLPTGLGLRVLAMGACHSAVLALMVAWMTRGDRPSDGAEPPEPWPAGWRFAVVPLLYLVTYFAAGMLVYPYIEHFYRTVAMPSLAVIILTQLLVRGPLFAALIVLLLRFISGSPAARAAWVATMMAVVGGIAPLVAPNAVFPDDVRWAHLIEVAVSNFLFGAAAAWILDSGCRRQPAAMRTSSGQSARPAAVDRAPGRADQNVGRYGVR